MHACIRAAHARMHRAHANAPAPAHPHTRTHARTYACMHRAHANAPAPAHTHARTHAHAHAHTRARVRTEEALLLHGLHEVLRLLARQVADAQKSKENQLRLRQRTAALCSAAGACRRPAARAVVARDGSHNTRRAPLACGADTGSSPSLSPLPFISATPSTCLVRAGVFPSADAHRRRRRGLAALTRQVERSLRHAALRHAAAAAAAASPACSPPPSRRLACALPAGRRR